MQVNSGALGTPPKNFGIKLYYSNFANSSNPFFKRGGNYNNTEANTGVFYSNNNNGGSNSNNGFRAVVCPNFDIRKSIMLLSQMSISLRRMLRGKTK